MGLNSDNNNIIVDNINSNNIINNNNNINRINEIKKQFGFHVFKDNLLLKKVLSQVDFIDMMRLIKKNKNKWSLDKRKYNPMEIIPNNFQLFIENDDRLMKWLNEQPCYKNEKQSSNNFKDYFKKIKKIYEKIIREKVKELNIPGWDSNVIKNSKFFSPEIITRVDLESDCPAQCWHTDNNCEILQIFLILKENTKAVEIITPNWESFDFNNDLEIEAQKSLGLSLNELNKLYNKSNNNKKEIYNTGDIIVLSGPLVHR